MITCIQLHDYVSKAGIPCPSAVAVIPPGLNLINPNRKIGLAVAIYYNESTWKAGNSAVDTIAVHVSLNPSATLDEAYTAIFNSDLPVFAGATVLTT